MNWLKSCSGSSLLWWQHHKHCNGCYYYYYYLYRRLPLDHSPAIVPSYLRRFQSFHAAASIFYTRPTHAARTSPAWVRIYHHELMCATCLKQWARTNANHLHSKKKAKQKSFTLSVQDAVGWARYPARRQSCSYNSHRIIFRELGLTSRNSQSYH